MVRTLFFFSRLAALAFFLLAVHAGAQALRLPSLPLQNLCGDRDCRRVQPSLKPERIAAAAGKSPVPGSRGDRDTIDAIAMSSKCRDGSIADTGCANN